MHRHNESFILGKCGTSKLVELTDLIYSLINKYGIEGEHPTHQRGSNRIDFIVYTPSAENLTISIGILPIHELSPSNHRRYILDVNRKAFLKDLDYLPSSNTRL